MAEKQQQIYYLLAYDMNEGKWMNADHIFGVLTEGKTVYESDGPGEEGKWIPLDAHVPALLDQDSDNIAVLSKFLRDANQG
jgi:hypothetical protein